ncbi:hypothetical protein [Allochromatium vinosum]
MVLTRRDPASLVAQVILVCDGCCRTLRLFDVEGDMPLITFFSMGMALHPHNGARMLRS